MNKPDYLISTPENVDLHLELAGLGNRLLAALADHILIGLMLLAIFVVCAVIGYSVDHSSLATEIKTIIYWYLIGFGLFCLFIVQFGYFVLFEGIWQGQTPGKRWLGIRVIEQSGQPVSWGAVWIRNLLRTVDELPGLFVGLLPMMADKNERRFGDLAAGTLVIRERLPSSLGGVSGLSIAGDTISDLHFDTGQVQTDEHNLIIRFLKRRSRMSAGARQRLACDLADHFKKKLALDANADPPELFLERLFVTCKQQAESE